MKILHKIFLLLLLHLVSKDVRVKPISKDSAPTPLAKVIYGWSLIIVVSDVGRSLNFYSDVVGMKQVMRPNFDRYCTPCL